MQSNDDNHPKALQSELTELKENNVHEDDIEAYIAHWYQSRSKSSDDDSLVVLYKNIKAFKWFKSHPYIWQFYPSGVISGADVTKIKSILSLEGFNSKQRKKFFKRFKHIERGVVEASFSAGLKKQQSET